MDQLYKLRKNHKKIELLFSFKIKTTKVTKIAKPQPKSTNKK